MDFRPISTTNTITTCNLIRVNAVLNLTLVLVYLSVEPYITAPHMSWLHQMHVLIQPLVLFVSISDSTIITLGSTVAAIIASVFDAVVVWLNYVAISRCFADPTPSCVEILWEKLFFFTLGCVILLSDVLMVLRLFTLQKAMSKKDTHEKASKDEYDSLAIKPLLYYEPCWSIMPKCALFIFFCYFRYIVSVSDDRSPFFPYLL